ncbi:MAG TPA: alpha-E domain-containing protein [Puia sp.]|nr:alpha-E domain-containing protein [Puia sp.]
MLSRIADSLFWLNRYMERSDGMLRLAGTHYIFSLDKDVNGTSSWKPVLEIFTESEDKYLNSIENNTEESLKHLLLDTTNTNCLKTLVNKARENARGVQDLITKEVWEEVNQMYHLINQSDLKHKIDSYHGLEVMEPLIKHTVLYTGITDITMPRGTGWCFMNLGKYIERCLQTIAFTEKQLEITNFKEADTNDLLQWKYLLFSLSGYELHVKTYRSSNHNYNVLHQVLINENFTRSVMYSMQRIELYLNKIIGNEINEERAALLRDFGRLFSKVRYMELDSLNKETVPVFFEDIKASLIEFNQRVVQHFFSYS